MKIRKKNIEALQVKFKSTIHTRKMLKPQSVLALQFDHSVNILRSKQARLLRELDK